MVAAPAGLAEGTATATTVGMTKMTFWPGLWPHMNWIECPITTTLGLAVSTTMPLGSAAHGNRSIRTMAGEAEGPAFVVVSVVSVAATE